MRISERLYALTSSEQQSRMVALAITRSTRAATASANVSANITNDLEGRLLIVTGMGLMSVPGATQNVATSNIELIPPNGASPAAPVYFKVGGAAGADVITGLDWSGEFVLGVGMILRANAQFSGAVANTLNFSAWGYSIPIGTLNAQ